ncbi:MAG: TIM barrel protein [Clostridia bacterium]|nr:TIM barrel protein [Clostridia bacterium]
MIKFGPSGNSLSFFAEGFSKTEQAAAFVKARGLNAYEYSFGRGIMMGEEKAELLGEVFTEAGVELSVHAPYYINFANPSDEMAQKSYDYVLRSAKMLQLMRGSRVIFHPASQGKMNREEAVALTENRLHVLAEFIHLNDMQNLSFCPETMGKLAQIGTIEEVCRFCKVDDVYLPCVDFGHVNAREQGSLKTEKDYIDRLSYMIDELGYEKMKHFHVHFSKIMYGAKGEVKHLTFEDDKYGPNFEPLASALHALKLEPVVISESDGMQVEEAKIMKDIYEKY